MSFDTPLLFLVFNRPSTTAQVFQRLRELQPTRLFVAADGPRVNRPDDLQNCAAVQAIFEGIDWDCQVTKLVRTENLGCGPAVSSAITWFFDQVEAGIILEDDCLPSLSFFHYASELLERYRDDERVLSISGTNLLGTVEDLKTSYYFTEFGGIWGWASWRRAWAPYDYRLAQWQDAGIREGLLSRFSKPTARYLEAVFNAATSMNTWDYQWWFSKLVRGGFDVVPVRNLVRNIGFDGTGTHTTDSVDQYADLVSQNLDFPLIHPSVVAPQSRLERRVSQRHYADHSRNLWLRAWRKLARLTQRSSHG